MGHSAKTVKERGEKCHTLYWIHFDFTLILHFFTVILIVNISCNLERVKAHNFSSSNYNSALNDANICQTCDRTLNDFLANLRLN